MVTDQQVRKLMKLIQSEPSLALAAAKAGMDEKTAGKYRRLRRLPSQCQQGRGGGGLGRWALARLKSGRITSFWLSPLSSILETHELLNIPP